MQRKTRSLVMFAILALLVGGMAHAQDISVNPNPPTEQVLPPGGGQEGGACGPISITQSDNLTPVPGSVSCNNMVGHTDNSYFRAFDLATDFGVADDFDVCEVQFAIESASGPDQSMTINVYAGPVGFPTGFPGSYTQVGTADITVAAQALTNITVPLTATIPAGSEMVVELFTPDGQAAANLIFIGSNPDPESGPSYLQAADCGLTTPNTVDSIGFPDMHIIMNVNGDVSMIAPPIPPTEVPTANTMGLAALFVLLAAAGFFAIRRLS